jgi:hypothetical protein
MPSAVPLAFNKSLQPTWVGPLRGFAVLCIFGAAVFFLVAGSGALQRHTESAVWPAIDAKVEECYLHSYYHFQRRVPGEQSQTRCTFVYDVAEVRYRQVLDAGSSVFTARKLYYLTQPKLTRESLTRWIARHPKGSTQAIHYNPANPQEISLAGADDDIQENTFQAQVRIATVFMTIGLLLLLVCAVARQKNVALVPQP